MSRKAQGFGLLGLLLAGALFGGLHAVLETALEGPRLYAEGSLVVGAQGGAFLPGSQRMDPGTVQALLASPLVRSGVPQTFSYAALAQEPVLVRGAPLADLLALHGARIVAGEMPSQGEPALLVGEALARRLGIRMGDVVPLAGAETIVRRAAGIVASPTALADQMLVDLGTGARLADLAPGAAHAVEVVPVDRDALEAWLAHTRADRLRLVAPAWAREGALVELRLVGADEVDGRVLVGPGDILVVTDAHGHARVEAHAGWQTWSLREAPEVSATFVAAASGLVPVRLWTVPSSPAPGERVRVVVESVDFGGGKPRQVSLLVDGAQAASLRLTGGLAEAPLRFEEAGERVLAVESVSTTVTVATPEALAAQWRSLEGPPEGLRAVSSTEASEALFGSVALAGGLLKLLAGLLLVAGCASILARLLRERAAESSLLHALGAPPARLRLVLWRGLAVPACAASLAGALLGVAATAALGRAGLLVLFGHQLSGRPGAPSLLVLALLVLAGTLLPSAFVVERALRRAERPSGAAG